METLQDYVDKYGEYLGAIEFLKAHPDWKNAKTFLSEEDIERIVDLSDI